MDCFFLSIIQFLGNTNGITYNNITQLLLSNLGWFSNNSGTYEKLTGTFTLVEKQGGFSQVNGTAIVLLAQVLLQALIHRIQVILRKLTEIQHPIIYLDFP